MKGAVSRNPNLKVNVLLDYTRGSRGEQNSRTMLLPLLQQSDSCHVRSILSTQQEILKCKMHSYSYFLAVFVSHPNFEGTGKTLASTTMERNYRIATHENLLV